MTMRSVLVMLVIVLCAACGRDAAMAPMAPSPTAPTLASSYQGTWTGETSQSERFGFVVTGNFVSRLEFSVRYADVSCSGGLGASQTLGSLGPISNAEFSATYTSPQGDLTWSMKGSFVSATTAIGTLHVTIMHNTPTGPVSGCSAPTIDVTWAAQKGS